MKAIDVRSAIEQGRYDIAAHLLILGLVSACLADGERAAVRQMRLDEDPSCR